MTWGQRLRRLGSLRKWLRALHRDVGYLAIGLTVVYALSGIAVNHLADWDPNFTQVDRNFLLPTLGEGVPALSLDDPSSARELASRILGRLGRKERIEDSYAVDATHLDITLSESSLHIDLAEGLVHEEGQRPRLGLRIANWLHLNRGKKAWTYIADGYAVFLLLLAGSGLFMLPGRKGIRGRGAVLALVGAAVPVLYVALSGGP